MVHVHVVYCFSRRGGSVLNLDFILPPEIRVQIHNENLEYWLYKNNLKKKDLAAQLGIQESQLTQYLKKPLGSELRFKVVEITQIEIEDLFGRRLANELIK